MNAARVLAAWNAFTPMKNRRRQAGFALHGVQRGTGVPPPVALARARFELEARQALRDWLMV